MRKNWKIWGGSLLLIALIGGAVAWRQAVTRTAPATTTETTRGTHAATASSATVTRTRATTWQTLKHPLKLPILMYHSISRGNQLRVPAAQFRREMVYLKRHHYRALTTQEAIRALTTNTVPQKKVVWITLDDAYRDNLTRALPILKETHLHATINVITGFTHKANHLSLAEMRAMRRTGAVDFASHTVQHLDLNALTAAQQRQELVASKRWLDQHPAVVLSGRTGQRDHPQVGPGRRVPVGPDHPGGRGPAEAGPLQPGPAPNHPGHDHRDLRCAGERDQFVTLIINNALETPVSGAFLVAERPMSHRHDPAERKQSATSDNFNKHSLSL